MEEVKLLMKSRSCYVTVMLDPLSLCNREELLCIDYGYTCHFIGMFQV